jgi:hypothetical protein
LIEHGINALQRRLALVPGGDQALGIFEDLLVSRATCSRFLLGASRRSSSILPLLKPRPDRRK